MKQNKGFSNKETKGFNVGETVKIIADWVPAEIKKKRVQILSFQNNGKVFAKVLWKGSTTVNYDVLYGDLFSIDELKKV